MEDQPILLFEITLYLRLAKRLRPTKNVFMCLCHHWTGGIAFNLERIVLLEWPLFMLLLEAQILKIVFDNSASNILWENISKTDGYLPFLVLQLHSSLFYWLYYLFSLLYRSSFIVLSGYIKVELILNLLS